jgi:hypothetical protein
MDMARTERLMEEVKARAGTRPACGWRGDWGAGANICVLRWMSQRLPGREDGCKCGSENLSKKFPISVFDFEVHVLVRACLNWRSLETKV